MNKWLLSIMIGLLSWQAQAALPPQYQNQNDLDVMVRFIQSHDEVAARLNRIDLDLYVVVYANRCQAIFERAYVKKSEGWVGPADPLEFKRSTCPLSDD